MAIEKAPASPRPPGHVPPGGRPYRVKDSDTWWSLAQTAGVGVWDLIAFNYGTRDPREVNWYMHHRVGCKTTTKDGKNWIFTSSATPGVIHLPPGKATAAAAAASRPPKPLDYGGLGIRVSGDDDHVARVKWVLDWIARSDSGLALLKAIGKTGKRLIITPFVPDSGTCTALNRNAYASPNDARSATKSGEWMLKNDDPGTPRDERFDPVLENDLVKSLLGLPQEPAVGSGKGSDVTVAFSPGMWGYGNQCSSTPGQPGSSPSEVLFHELVHAYRQMRGHLHRVPTVGGRRQYDNEEEFFAVMVTNVWVSDPTNPNGARTLRADHWGFAPLAPALSSSKGFVSQQANRRIVEKLVRDEPELVTVLKGVKSSFNPLTAL